MSSMYEKFSPTHPDLYSAESGITYEPIGPVTEGMPYKANVRYKGADIPSKEKYSTVFPDNWSAEKITQEVERIISEKLVNEPGKQTLIGEVEGSNFAIEVIVNVKANGTAKVVTAYPLIE